MLQECQHSFPCNATRKGHTAIGDVGPCAHVPMYPMAPPSPPSNEEVRSSRTCDVEGVERLEGVREPSPEKGGVDVQPENANSTQQWDVL